MTPTTTTACPRCNKPISAGTKFCASCGLDISGVWGVETALGGTVAVEMDPNVDVLGQMLSEATIGDYDIYGELGRGGMAAVYLGLDLALNRKVAIKTMLPELVSREGMVERFKREAKTSAALSHPHVIQIFTVKETPQLVFFVMKFIEGRSLESVINDKGGISLDMAQVLLGQVGSALAYAHRKSVIHRDIKPANIMIDEDGWAIVTDFGIAKVQEAQNLTATGTAIGTPHYMSPEQFHNKAVTGASDQYSLGVVAYEMLTGKKPFDGATYAEIITQHLFEAPPDPRKIKPELPAGVNDVIKKMMAKDPGDRFADAEQAAQALAAVHMPAKQSGDVVRTQMISLAKSGPQKKVRMSVPMSPIPAGKKPGAPAATAMEPQSKVKGARPRPQAAPAATAVMEKSGGGAGKWIFLSLLLILGAGGGYYYMTFMRPKQQGQQQVAAQSTTPSDAPASTVNQDSLARARQDSIVNAQASAIAERLTAKQDSARRADSIRSARVAAANAAKTPTNRGKAPAPATPTNTRSVDAPAQSQQAPPPVTQAPPPAVQTPAAPQFGEIRIGSRTTEAFLYIDGQVQGQIGAVKYYRIPAGTEVKLSVRSVKCPRSWDSTVVVGANEQKTVGYRTLEGCSP